MISDKKVIDHRYRPQCKRTLSENEGDQKNYKFSDHVNNNYCGSGGVPVPSSYAYGACNNAAGIIQKQRHRSIEGTIEYSQTPSSSCSGKSSRTDSISSTAGGTGYNGNVVSSSLRRLFPFDFLNFGRPRAGSDADPSGLNSGQDDATDGSTCQGERQQSTNPPHLHNSKILIKSKHHGKSSRSSTPVGGIMGRLRSFSLTIAGQQSSGADIGKDGDLLDPDIEYLQSGYDRRRLRSLPDPGKMPKEYPRSSLLFTADLLASGNDHTSVSRKGNNNNSHPKRNSGVNEVVQLQGSICENCTTISSTIDRNISHSPYQPTSLECDNTDEDSPHCPSHHSQRRPSGEDTISTITAPNNNSSTILVPQSVATNSKMSGNVCGLLRSSVLHETDRFIVFKDKSEHGPDIMKIIEESLVDSKRVYSIFMHHHTCYDLIPMSSKLVVFDIELAVRRAFFGLVYNGVRAAPLWDSNTQQFVGMLTITDFITILTQYYSAANLVMEEFENQKISQWRKAALHNGGTTANRPLIHATPEDSLFMAVQKLLWCKVHRLPIVDLWSGNVLHILTPKRILKYLSLYTDQLPIPDFMQCTLQDEVVGTFKNVSVVREDTKLIDVLRIFVSKRVSALPVVNADNILIDIYSKFDVINLAATQTYNKLDITVTEAVGYRKEKFEGVVTCKKSDTVYEVFRMIVTAGVHRLVVIDDTDHVIGVVSLSDLLNYMITDITRTTNTNM